MSSKMQRLEPEGLARRLASRVIGTSSEIKPVFGIKTGAATNLMNSQ
jgi:hypothetical protein